MPPTKNAVMNHCLDLIIRNRWAVVRLAKITVKITAATMDGSYLYRFNFPFAQYTSAILAVEGCRLPDPTTKVLGLRDKDKTT